MTSPLALAAADYLSKGLAVIALTGKTPNTAIHKRGLDQPLEGAAETQSDLDLLDEVFDHPDTTGIGILTRHPLVVVDIDGEEGAAQFMEEFADDDPLPDRWVARTGRGLHLYLGCPIETGTIKLGPKLDLKGTGGYVAAPPSKHPDGHLYEWIAPPEGPPLMVPMPLLQRIGRHLESLERAMAGKALRRPIRQPRYTPGDTVFYAQLGYDALIEGMATAEEGNRNNYLHWAAATLAEEGGIDEDFEQLGEAALAVGLEPIEVRRTLRSARRLHG